MNSTDSTKTPEPPALAQAPCSALWAVSIVLLQHKQSGNMNVLNHLHRVRAANKDEAVGVAIRLSLEKCPEHQIHCYTALEFADAPNIKDEPRPL